jgi:hypothetical protein
MKRLSLLATLLLLTLAAGCHVEQFCDRPIPLDRDTDLKVGECGTIESSDVVIRVLTVVDDSRCPTDVTCVWEGNARVSMEYQIGGGTAIPFELNTHNTMQQSIDVGLYNVSLVDVKPHPLSTVKIDPNEYVATIHVRTK